MLDLTVMILTKNEEKNLEKCIRSLDDIAKRVVIVDSFSTDGSEASVAFARFVFCFESAANVEGVDRKQRVR